MDSRLRYRGLIGSFWLASRKVEFESKKCHDFYASELRSFEIQYDEAPARTGASLCYKLTIFRIYPRTLAHIGCHGYLFLLLHSSSKAVHFFPLSAVTPKCTPVCQTIRNLRLFIQPLPELQYRASAFPDNLYPTNFSDDRCRRTKTSTGEQNQQSP